MDGFRRARTTYDMYGERPGSNIGPLPEIPSATYQDMPTDGYMETLQPLGGSQTARCVSTHGSRPRTRASLTPRGAYDVGLQPDLPSLMPQEDDNPFTNRMDPVNQQYYYREWLRKPPLPRKPIYRSGRLGSPWRHVKSCINNGGTHLVFIDGTVKTEENYFYPPEDALRPPDLSMFISPRLMHRTRNSNLNTNYNTHAKQGLKYWYQDPKPINSYEKERASRQNQNISAKYNFGGRSRWLGVSGESLAARNPSFTIRY